MLNFKETSKHYEIVETIHSFHNTETKTVKYSKDLSTCQVNTDPVRDTTSSQRDRFNKYYRAKFNN